ncbi:MAG: sigma-54-dependent Fis family transcriptional regulator [Candidatus Schekmanbacteria bacterium]|nr:sigma-54-dependent Fis family transcriptional regulator [Candidatus Schekmanbacteria bacterium]
MTKSEATSRILVVDDEADMLTTCRKILVLENYEVDTAASAAEGFDLYSARRHDLVITDLRMPNVGGMELMARIRELVPDQLVVMLTAYSTIENAIAAIRSGAFDFLRKPFTMDELLVVVLRALRFRALREENAELSKSLPRSFKADPIVGRSKEIRQALQALGKVCEIDVPVLISGETGTGKELFAQVLHDNSARRDGPFIAVNCAAIPEALLESELFGYERGAFTGASASRSGLIESASGGTLLLDEIGDMPMVLQGKLLRTLETGHVRRLGSDRERAVDFRVVSATHRDLGAMVGEGTFRSDLHFRINVVHLVVPPLREREGDVAVLAEHFFERFRSRTRRAIDGISAAAMLILEQYGWPGNVRELRNAIERAGAFAESTQVMPEDLPPALLSAVEGGQIAVEGGSFRESRHAAVERFERGYISKQLRLAGGNVTQAAHLSRLTRQAFHRLMSKYGIQGDDFRD